MKTVITGGAGFIGSHLVKRLIDQGREVIVAGDFSRTDRRNLNDLGINTDWPIVDLRDYNQTLNVMRGAGTVFHLAARIGNIEYLHGSSLSELEALETNLVIDANVCRACLENGVKKIVYASSAAVYPVDIQESTDVVISEDTLRYFKPDGGYGWAKLMCEIQLGWMKNIDIGIARIFNVYGENSVIDGSSHVIIDLMRKAIFHPKEEFTVWGHGKQSRDFLYVSDCVDALLKLEEAAANPPVTVNIGSGETVEISTIAEKVLNLTGKNIKINYDINKPIGPLSRTADITRAKTLLGWRPKVDLSEGMVRTYLWLKKRLREENTR